MDDKIPTKEVRQGVTGHKVRYVLFGSIALAIVAMIVIYAIFA